MFISLAKKCSTQEIKKTCHDLIFSHRYLDPEDVQMEEDRCIEPIFIQGYSHGGCSKEEREHKLF